MTSYLVHLTQIGLSATAPVMKRLLEINSVDWDSRPEPDRFNLREMLAHLADMEMVWVERVQAILDAPGEARMPGKDPDVLARQNNYESLDPRDSLAWFETGRQALLKTLEALAEEQWDWTGTHEEFGRMSVFQLTQFVLGHDGYHLKQVVEWTA